MRIIFVTGNMDKFAEAKSILSDHDIVRKEYDIEEIQGTSQDIILDKMRKAYAYLKRPCFVEDVSLEISGLNGLPGPYIKDFYKKLGVEGIYKLLNRKDKNAKAIAYIGYTDGKKEKIFKGSVNGRICKPSKKRTFAFDPIFIPKGYSKPYSELVNKNKISHRRKALEKLRKYLEGLK